MRGISPVVAFVLLLAISAIAGIAAYFWIGTINMKATSDKLTNPNTPIAIDAIGSKYILVSNLGTNPISSSVLKTDDPNLAIHCKSDVIEPGGQTVCELIGKSPSKNVTIAVFGKRVSVAIVRFGSAVGETYNRSEWYFSGFPYRQRIDISGAGQTNYQMPIDLDANNVGKHFDWSAERLGFTYLASGAETEIPFWIEYWDSAGKKARVWVKLPFVGEHTTIYMYYGNASMPDMSNVSAVFIRVVPGLVADWSGDANLTGMQDMSGNGHFCRYGPIRFANTGFQSYLGHIVPENSEAVGVLGTDGRYLYGKSWGSYDYNDNWLTRIGTGLHETDAGKDYGDVAQVSSSLSGFYLDGYFYNGYTSNGSNLQRYNITTGEMSYVKLGAPLMDRDYGTNLSSASSNILVTTDGRYVYDLAYGKDGSRYGGWSLKIFDPQDAWKQVKFIKWGDSSYYTDGVVADGNYIYAIKWTGIVTAFDWNGKNVSSWETDQGSTRVINGQYDWVNNRIWLGGLGYGNAQSANSAPYDYIHVWQGHASKAQGMYGNALSFDGFDDYMDCGNAPDLNTFPNGLTLEVIGKQTAYTNGLDTWAIDKDYTGYRLWGIDKLMFGVRSPSQGWTMIGSVRPELNKWYHVFGVADNTGSGNTTLQLYINGKLNASFESQYKYNFGSYPTDVILGKHSTQPRYWPGVLDEVRIYNRPLNASVIRDISNNYGFSTPHYPGHLLVRKNHYPEPTYVIRQEEIENWYYSGWDYRLPITVKNLASTDLTGFPVKIVLTSSNFDFSHAKPDGSDVRVTYVSNGEVAAPYWVEYWNASEGKAIIWTRLNLRSHSDLKVYVYYGNPSASDAGTPQSVFTFFDGFDSNVLDSGIWGNTSAVSVGGGYLNISHGSVYSKSEIGSTPVGYAFEMKARYHTQAESYSGLMIADSQSTQGSNAGSNALIYIMTNGDSNPYMTIWGADGTTASYNIICCGRVYNNLQDEQDYVMGFNVTESGIYYYLLNPDHSILGVKHYTKAWSKPFYMWMGYFTGSSAGNANIDDISIDWVRIRKISSPEPSVSIGSEQTVPS